MKNMTGAHYLHHTYDADNVHVQYQLAADLKMGCGDD